MGKRNELIQKYAEDLKEKCNVTPDMDLLTKVTIGCGPSIYNADASTVASSDPKELATVRNNFLIKKLGLPDYDKLVDGIEKVVVQLGRSNSNYFSLVIYYLMKCELS